MSSFSPKTTEILVDVFDNNIYSSKLSKWVNYFIILLIIVATLEIILATEPSFFKYNSYLEIIYYTTSGTFLLEIILRFLVSGNIDKKYSGFRGKIVFATEFYNLIDIISILPFILGFAGIELYPFLKALRVFRILKIMRYLPSVGLLMASIKNKQSELIISIQTIFILAVLLSIGLYYAESEVENSQFNSISQALLWSIAKFIGDIGGYGDFLPVTNTGKILATLNGVLGIAIFALPAGIIGSGFVEEIEDRKALKELNETDQTLKDAFKTEHLANTIRIKEKYGLGHLRRRLLKISDIKYKLNIREEQLYDIIHKESNFRFRNYSLINKKGIKQDEYTVEFYDKNTTYGTFKERDSELLILSVSSRDQPFLGHFSYALSEYLKCSYLSVETFSRVDLNSLHRKDFKENTDFFISSDDVVIEEFKSDLCSLSKSNKIIIHLAGKKSDTDSIELGNGGQAGTMKFADVSTFSDLEKLRNYCYGLQSKLNEMHAEMAIHKNYGIESEHHVNWYLHNELGFDVIQMYISAEIMKDEPETYYKYVHCLGESLNFFHERG